MNRQQPRTYLPERIEGPDFEYVRGLVKEHTAISLDTSKIYLISARLLPVARANRFATVLDLIRHMKTHPFGELHWQAVESIVTTETSFFRDFFPFEALQQEIIPEVIDRERNRTRTLSIWSAGCSSGQEPFSIAMMLREHFPELASWNVRILASDVSKSMLDRAQVGTYSQIEINRGLPASLLVKYFEQEGNNWRVSNEIRRMVTFFQHNLVRDYPNLPPVDVLLMRNVLIYFDVDTKRLILDRVRRHLRPSGLLVLGTAETTLNLDQRFERVRIRRAVFYRSGREKER
jgi:chemotaxis protein methyltransferase CheR